MNLKTNRKIKTTSISDILGKIGFNQNNNSETMDVFKLIKCIYFRNAKIEGKIVVEKFIIE